MVAVAEPFGPRLRALRVARGLTLSEFARRLFYSKGHVSRIETGVAPPSSEFARRCDTELGADGALVALVPGPAKEPLSAPTSDPGSDPDDDGMWIMAMAPDGAGSFVSLRRRDMLVGGTALFAGLATGTAPQQPADVGQLDHYSGLLAIARKLGQVSPPEAVLPMVVGQAQALRLLAPRARRADAGAVAALLSRTTEYAGWLAQESGDDRMALWWTGQAARAAAAVGDHHMASYALVRRALVALYQGDAATTIALARRAQLTPDTPGRVLGLAAQREAQGHALAGNHKDCFRALEVARSHLAVAEPEENPAMVIGTSFVPDPVAVVTGWCLHDLGRPADAAAVLDVEVTRIASTAVRARLRFGIRRALAHAAAGEVDHACMLAEGMLGQARAVSSATVRVDIRRLAVTLRRFSTHAAVRALTPAFATALHPATA